LKPSVLNRRCTVDGGESKSNVPPDGGAGPLRSLAASLREPGAGVFTNRLLDLVSAGRFAEGDAHVAMMLATVSEPSIGFATSGSASMPSSSVAHGSSMWFKRNGERGGIFISGATTGGGGGGGGTRSPRATAKRNSCCNATRLSFSRSADEMLISDLLPERRYML
jgi:hypothetical protein